LNDGKAKISKGNFHYKAFNKTQFWVQKSSLFSAHSLSEPQIFTDWADYTEGFYPDGQNHFCAIPAFARLRQAGAESAEIRGSALLLPSIKKTSARNCRYAGGSL
jgi:hypothetical protein